MNSPTTNDPRIFWNQFDLKDGENLCWDVGALCLHAHRMHADWSLAWKISDSPAEDRTEVNRQPIPPDLEAQRWVFSNPLATLSILPEMPDRPLVVRPREPICIPAKTSLSSYIHFPTQAGVAVMDGKHRIPLISIYTERLSNTWFGENTSGELAYACRTPMARDAESPELLASHVLCPFRVRNASDSLLRLERVLLRMKPLAIYLGQKRLWTNEVSVVFKGESVDVQIEYASTPPQEADGAILLTEAAEKPDRGFLRHAFGAHSLFRKKD
jgi:hypothetical protein